MREILAFGDSLTRGTDPGRNRRHAYADRWPSVLEAGLGDGFRVIAEGMGGRTSRFDDPSSAADRNGANVLPMLLASHAPLDLVIIMLGSNDLKPSICGKAEGAAEGVARLVAIIQQSGASAQILLVSPPHFAASDLSDGKPKGGRSIAESRRLAPLYAALARKAGIGFFDAATVATASPVDGVHLDAANTRAIGRALIPVVQGLLGGEPICHSRHIEGTTNVA